MREGAGRRMRAWIREGAGAPFLRRRSKRTQRAPSPSFPPPPSPNARGRAESSRAQRGRSPAARVGRCGGAACGWAPLQRPFSPPPLHPLTLRAEGGGSRNPVMRATFFSIETATSAQGGDRQR